MIEHHALSAGIAPGTAQWLYIAEMEHRVANEYARAIASISLDAARCADADAKATLGSAAQRLRNYHDLHRALQAPLDSRLIDLSVYLRGLCAALVKAGLGERGIHLILKEKSVEIDAQRCWRVGLIVSELITNAVRHAFGGGPGSIIVEVVRSAGHVYCLVSDDGRSSSDLLPGKGTHLVDALAEDIRGRVDRQFSRDGSAVLLWFPERGDEGIDTFAGANPVKRRGRAPETMG